MSETFNLIAYNPNIETLEYRPNMPLHPDMEDGLPWTYIDQDSVVFYPSYHDVDSNLWIVKANRGKLK